MILLDVLPETRALFILLFIILVLSVVLFGYNNSKV